MQELKKDLLKVAKPVLFNTEMVRAILDGRKTVTRRLVKNLEIEESNGLVILYEKNEDDAFCISPMEYAKKEMVSYCQFQPGDVLYVRETWCYHKDAKNPWYGYKADGDYRDVDLKWHPSLHMPKEAARIFLRVKDVRVERLQDITEEQAKAEGICRLYDDMSKEEYEAWARKVGKMEPQEECSFKNYLWHGNFGSCGCGNKLSDAWEYQFSGYDSAVSSFSSLWNTTVELKDWNQYGWDANPWVWVIEFERIEPESEVWLCRNLLRN